MQDTNNMAIIETSANTDVLSLANEWYPILHSACSVRAQNVLNDYRAKFDSKTGFYKALLDITEIEAKNLRNCGTKTVVEIMTLSQELRQNTGYTSESAKAIPSRNLPENIDKILPIVIEKTCGLTHRSRNAVILFIHNLDNSVQQLYSRISSPDFSAFNLKNIGHRTAEEVGLFLNDIKTMIESFEDASAVESFVGEQPETIVSTVPIPPEFHENINALKEQLGYFPLFAAISAYLKGLPEQSKVIVDGCIRVHIGQTLKSRENVAALLDLSGERVRQKRNKIIEKLSIIFGRIRITNSITDNPYSYIMTHTEDYVNSTEGTDFTANFIRWVLGSAFDEITIVGDVTKPLTNLFNDELFINIVPTELCQYFDFNAYVAALDEKLAEKRTDEERVNLKSFMQSFFKVKYYEDHEKDIENVCRSILYLTYELEVDMGQIIFKPNKRKNNPDIIEDILRAAGHPMTLDEIFDEFSFQYPERSTTITSLRGSVISNPNIIPIGRTSTYTLSEWNGEGNKGGTIRSLAIEYLNSIPSRIALFSEVAEYIVKYRPATNEPNIYDNLCQERTGVFKFYFLQGERYLGLGGREYPMEYFPLESESKSAMNMSIKYPMLINFIEANGRFPFSSGVDEEEIALYHFWSKQEKLFKEGNIEHHSQLFFQRIQEQYGQLKFEKKEFEWKQTFKQIIDLIEIEGYEMLPLPDKEWVKKNCSEYRYFKEKMPSWKVELIEKYLLKY